MVTDPTMEELTSISVDYKIDMDDLKRHWIQKNAPD